MKAKLLVVAFLGAVVAVWVLNVSHSDVTADTPHAGLNFSIGIDTSGDGIDDCSSSGFPTNICQIDGNGVPVAVDINLESSGLDSRVPPGYQGYQISIASTGAGFQSVVVHTWPDCGAPNGPTFAGSGYTFGCYVSPWTHLSTFSGKIAEVGYTLCQSSDGVITLVHGPGPAGTKLIDGDGNANAEGNGTTESLLIPCRTATPPPSPSCTNPGMLGDVDSNGQVNAIDALFLFQSTLNQRTLACPGNADVDNNHTGPQPDARDGQVILQYVAGLIHSLPP